MQQWECPPYSNFLCNFIILWRRLSSQLTDISVVTLMCLCDPFLAQYWATILRCAVSSLASFPGLSWEWGYTLFWYDYCMRPWFDHFNISHGYMQYCRCWLLSACAYNSWQQGTMRLTADVRLTKNSCLINGCKNSGWCFRYFGYIACSTWQFRGCFGTSSGTEGPSLDQAFSSFFVLLDTFCSTHSA